MGNTRRKKGMCRKGKEEEGGIGYCKKKREMI
jgi:hypothetical protein